MAATTAPHTRVDPPFGQSELSAMTATAFTSGL
jgi:hypothetical protein